VSTCISLRLSETESIPTMTGITRSSPPPVSGKKILPWFSCSEQKSPSWRPYNQGHLSGSRKELDPASLTPISDQSALRRRGGHSSQMWTPCATSSLATSWIEARAARGDGRRGRQSFPMKGPTPRRYELEEATRKAYVRARAILVTTIGCIGPLLRFFSREMIVMSPWVRWTHRVGSSRGAIDSF